jgi:hypothetical protein
MYVLSGCEIWAELRDLQLLKGSLVIIGILTVACSFLTISRKDVRPSVVPYEGAPVTVTIRKGVLVIANNGIDDIYFQIFPTEILPVIEWAPCIAPETCPAEQQVSPGGEKRIALKTIVRNDTESITLFWWRYLEKKPGASVPPLEMEEIQVILP